MTEPSDNNITQEIPPTGNLGLLAYGHKGVIAWRRAREKTRNKSAASQSEVKS